MTGPYTAKCPAVPYCGGRSALFCCPDLSDDNFVQGGYQRRALPLSYAGAANRESDLGEVTSASSASALAQISTSRERQFFAYHAVRSWYFRAL